VDAVVVRQPLMAPKAKPMLGFTYGFLLFRRVSSEVIGLALWCRSRSIHRSFLIFASVALAAWQPGDVDSSLSTNLSLILQPISAPALFAIAAHELD